MANPKTPITELDFDSIKSQLKTYLQTQTQFKDYNFEGSNMSVLLDVLAFNSFQNNFYTNMALNEMFLDSAVLKNSVVSHAKELNYIPRSRKSAKATVTVTVVDPNLTASTITIPQYSTFSATYQGETYNFVNDIAYVARRTAPGTYVAENVEIFEGQMLTSFQREGFIVDADGVLRVQLTNDEVDTDSIVVFVDAEATEDQNVFTRANTIFGVEPLDKVFYLEPYLDNRYAIYFGGNKFGLQPEEFEDVRVRYRICSGDEPNGAASFTTSFLDGASINVATVIAANGGAERESLESIRYFAPKALQIQERAVTTSDYEVLLKQRYPEISAVSAYGGELLDPPQYGKVAISVYLADDTTLISSTLANAYVEYLATKSPLGIEPIFVQTKFLYADVTVDATYTTKNTAKSVAELESLIRAQIQTYSNTNLENFNRTLRLSKLNAQIDGLDTGIQSNSINIMPIIEYSPTINIETNPTFKFEAELIKPYPYRSFNGFTDYKPAIKSSVFDDADGTCVFLQDDGTGTMMTVSDDETNPQIINPNAGTVNYTTGEVRLLKFQVSGYTGSAIKIMANTKKSDVKAPQGRVFIIRDVDVKVNMTSDTQGSTSSSSPATSTTSSSSSSSY
jgi:YHS domain-containing protein